MPPPHPRPQVDQLEASVEPSWEGLVQPLERIVDRLSRAWGTVSHLKAVKDTEELRKVCNKGGGGGEGWGWGGGGALHALGCVPLGTLESVEHLEGPGT